MEMCVWLLFGWFLAVNKIVCFGYGRSAGSDGNNVKTKTGQNCGILHYAKPPGDVFLRPYVLTSAYLPSDFFKGSEYTLEVTEVNTNSAHCWFNFNSISRMLNLLADEKIVKNQPRDGYKFELKASNKCSKQVLTKYFYVHIESNQKHVMSCLTIDLEIKLKQSFQRYSCAIKTLVDILQKVEKYFNVSHAIHVYEYKKSRNNLKISFGLLEELTHCRTSCNKPHLHNLAHKIVSEFGDVNENFRRLLSPLYSVFSVYTNAICPQDVKMEIVKGSREKTCSHPTIYNRVKDVSVPAFQSSVIKIDQQKIFRDKNNKISISTSAGVKDEFCWYYLTKDYDIRTFPINQIINSQAHKIVPVVFNVKATNECGKSNSFNFKVSIRRQLHSPCFVIDVLFQTDTFTCEAKALKNIEDFLKYNLPLQNFGNIYVISANVITVQKIKVSIAGDSGDQSCSYCSNNYIHKIKDTLRSKATHRFYNVIIMEVQISSGCKCNVEHITEKYTLTAKSSIINKFYSKKIGRFIGSESSLEIPFDMKENICVLNEVNEKSIWYLPKEGSQYGDKNREIILKRKGCSNELQDVILKTPYIHHYHSCLSVSLRFSTIETDGTKSAICFLPAIDNMIGLFAAHVGITRDKIVILSYFVKRSNVISVNTMVDLELGFLGCDKYKLFDCLKKINKHQIREFLLKILKVGHNAIKNLPLLNLYNATLNECDFDPDVIGLVHTSSSFTPLWIYLLPAFLALLILLALFLILCCCCCTDGGYFCCLLRCCGVKTTTTKVHHVSSSYPNMDYTSAAVGSKSAGNVSIVQVENGTENTYGINSTKISNAQNTGTVPAENKIFTATSEKSPHVTSETSEPVVKKYTKTTTTRETTIKRNVIPDTECYHSNKQLSDFDKSPTFYTVLNGSRRENIKKNSTRRERSHSDGFLLDDYKCLTLPRPPKPGNDIHRRVGSSVKAEDDISTNSIGSKLVIPIRLTARVKMLSKSNDDILSFRKSRKYTKFDGADFECDTPNRRKAISKNGDSHVRFDTQSINEFSSSQSNRFDTDNSYRSNVVSHSSLNHGNYVSDNSCSETQKYLVESWKDNRKFGSTDKRSSNIKTTKFDCSSGSNEDKFSKESASWMDDNWKKHKSDHRTTRKTTSDRNVKTENTMEVTEV